MAYPHYPYCSYPIVTPVRTFLRNSKALLQYALLDDNNELRDVSSVIDILARVYDSNGVQVWAGSKSGGEVVVPTSTIRGNVEVTLSSADTLGLSSGAYDIAIELQYTSTSNIEYRFGKVILISEHFITYPPTVAPPLYNFGDVSVGSPSVAVNFLITNPTKEDIIITEVRVAGTDAADFSATPSGTGSWSVTKHGGTLNVSVIFTPSKLGTHNAVLELLYATNTLSATLIGVGV